MYYLCLAQNGRRFEHLIRKLDYKILFFLSKIVHYQLIFELFRHFSIDNSNNVGFLGVYCFCLDKTKTNKLVRHDLGSELIVPFLAFSIALFVSICQQKCWNSVCQITGISIEISTSQENHPLYSVWNLIFTRIWEYRDWTSHSPQYSAA